MKTMNTFFIIFFILILLPDSIYGECTCELGGDDDVDKSKARKLKIIALVSILVSSAIGVLLPLLGKILPSFSPGRNIFFLIKAFAAGVILATGFIHVLPDAFESLTSPCLDENTWGDFPFTGLVAMAAAIGTMMVDTVANAYFKKVHHRNGKGDEETSEGNEACEGHVHVHTHTTHGHAHGSTEPSENLLRHRIISQVLEAGIIVHSVIIGISLGASMSPKTIKPLVVALSFHQFFEGMGLGSCISEAEFKAWTITIMSLFFSLTTPLGIVVGLGISTSYNENSPTALIVQGIFNSASAGILIYMALVDLLAADFMKAKLQNSLKLQLQAYTSLLLGSGCMALLAKWA